jgi:hypothetical protein
VKERDQTPGDPNERLDAKVYADLAKVGWRIPESEAEVRAAEEWAGKSPGELPQRLRVTPATGSSELRTPGGGILSRYLRDDVHPSTTRDDRSSDEQHRDFEPER